MIKIKVVTENPKGAVAFYRSVGPLLKLNRLDEKIVVQQLTAVDWYTIQDADIIFFERLHGYVMRDMIQLCRNYSIPVWSDYDDDLFNLPDHNPGYPYYSLPETQKTIVECIQLSNVVTTTTKDLYEKLLTFNENVKIIPNAFNDYNLTLSEKCSKNRSINWRGSQTHRKDLQEYGDQMVRIKEEFPKWLFTFIGNDVWYITDRLKNFNPKHQVNELNSIEYWDFLKKVSPGIQQIPLQFNTFNCAKSNIGWLEGTYAGAACLGPDMEEWRVPGCTLYNSPQDYYDKLVWLMDDYEERKKLFKLSKDYVQDNLMLSKVNKKRLEIIDSVL